MQKSTFTSILRIGFTTVLAGVINYIYHPLMLQFMSIETFGEFTAILGIFNILGVLTTGIGLFLMQKIAQAYGDQGKIYQIFHWSLPRSVVLGIGVFVCFLLLTPLIKQYLHLESYLPLILVGTSIIVSFVSLPFSSLVQGLQHFTFMGINSIFGAGAKFLLGLGLAYLGFEIYAAIGGLIGGGILGIMILAGWCYFKIFAGQKLYVTPNTAKGLDQSLFQESKNLISMLVLVLLLSFFMNGDVILARNLFDPNTAGIYGSIAVIGKFVIFVGAAIETVYYPKVIQYKIPSKVPFPRLKNPFLLLIFCMFGAVVGTFFLGPYVLKLMKPELVSHSHLLIFVVMMSSLYGFISLYAKILVAWKDKRVNWILGVIGLLLILILYVFPLGTLAVYVFSISVAEILILFLLLWRIQEKRKSLLSSPLPGKNEKSDS